jgi:fructose-specific phosphotransferase system IIC component
MKNALRLSLILIITFITTLLIAGFLFLYSNKTPVHKKENGLENNLRER